jgi:hypothetical protein
MKKSLLIFTLILLCQREAYSNELKNSLPKNKLGLGSAKFGGKLGGTTSSPSGPEVSGGLSSQEILAVIRSHRPQLQKCRVSAAKKDPRVKGDLKVSWDINLDGRVQSIKITKNTLKNKFLVRCVISKIKKWIFPKPRGGGLVSVKYPFQFSSGDGADKKK